MRSAIVPSTQHEPSRGGVCQVLCCLYWLRQRTDVSYSVRSELRNPDPLVVAFQAMEGVSPHMAVKLVSFPNNKRPQRRR